MTRDEQTVHGSNSPTSTVRRVAALHNQLSVYQIGEGEPLLLFPYPHGATYTSMSESPLCDLLAGLGRSVITFDPPQAYASTRAADYTLKEMLGCAEEALEYFGVQGTLDVVGHSMGGFCALAFAIEKKAWVKKLLVVCGNPGYSEVSSQWFDSKLIRGWDFLKLTYYGFKEIVGLGSLYNHKKMNNLLDYHLFEDKTYFVPREIHAGDKRRPSPLRNRWMNTVRNENYSASLNQITAPVLILSGKSDILSSEKVNRQMQQQIQQAKIEYFEKSRHFPFIEERARFIECVSRFLNET